MSNQQQKQENLFGKIFPRHSAADFLIFCEELCSKNIPAEYAGISGGGWIIKLSGSEISDDVTAFDYLDNTVSKNFKDAIWTPLH